MATDQIKKPKERLALPLTNPKLLVERIITAVGVLEDNWEDFRESITTNLVNLHSNLYQELTNRLSKLNIQLGKTYNGVLIGSMAITRAISQAIESVASQINRSSHLSELIAKVEFGQLLSDQLDDIALSLSRRLEDLGTGFSGVLKAQTVPVRVW